MHSHQHSHILSYGMAWTVRFVIRCGSYIHTWWVLLQQYLVLLWQHYGISRPMLPLKWYSLCRKNSTIIQQHRQWRMWIQSCLSRPLRSMWLFFNAFTPAFFSLHLQYVNKGTPSLYPPLTPTPPLSDHFILHPNPCWLLCTLFPLPASRLCSSLPLSSVSPSFLVAVSLW